MTSDLLLCQKKEDCCSRIKHLYNLTQCVVELSAVFQYYCALKRQQHGSNISKVGHAEHAFCFDDQAPLER